MSRDAGSESSSSSSDEGSDVSEMDAEFLQTLAKIKQRDPAIYDRSHRLFDANETSVPSDGSADLEDDGQLPVTSETDRKPKPKFLRQVLAEQALQGNYGSDEETANKQQRQPRTYHEEQNSFKDAFLQAADAAGDDVGGGEFGNVLNMRSGRTAGPPDPAGLANEAVVKELLVKCFGSEGQTQDPSDAFLHDYMQRQAWRPVADEASPPPEEAITNDLDADMEHTEQAERFEANFNFRFEEPGSSHTITYPREMEGTVRKKDERRKLARQRKALRQEEEQRRLEEEAKRLRKAERRAKAVEQAAIVEQHTRSSLDPADQVAALREAAGTAGPDEQRLLAMMADEDFDPDAYDAAMASAFDSNYYEASEEFGGDNTDEEWDAGIREEGDDDGSQGEAAAAQLPEASSDSEDDEDGMLPAVSGSGFRYRKVPKADYGLSIEEMLTMDPKELNQVVSVKRLAPYRNDRYAPRPNWQKIQELRDQQAASVAARKPRSSKTKHKLRSHEKAALYAQEAAQGCAHLPHAAASKLSAKPGSKSGNKHSAQQANAAHKPGGVTGNQNAAKERPSKAIDSTPLVSDTLLATKPGQQPTEAAVNGIGMTPASTVERDASKKAREQERRLQSYNKLTLRKEGPSEGSKKRSAAQAEVTRAGEEGISSGLGKQAKKRLKRSAKRAAARMVPEKA